MFTSILLAILVSASPADLDSAPPASPLPLKVSVGPMSFSGDTIKLTKSDKGAVECEIDGHAALSIADTDIVVRAQKMVISRNAISETTIRCTGECNSADSEHTCSANRMQIALAQKVELQLFGDCRLEYAAGHNRSVLSAESITYQDVHRRLEADKGTNYSTTVKMLSVMLRKGLLKRDEESQPHIYRPALSRAKAGKLMVYELIDKVYGGSAMSLVLQALSAGKATKEELDEIRRLLDQMEGKEP